jgi:hypothetical protein
VPIQERGELATWNWEGTNVAKKRNFVIWKFFVAAEFDLILGGKLGKRGVF